MPRSRQPEGHFPLKLTQAQRKAVAEIAPELVKRLKLDDRGHGAFWDMVIERDGEAVVKRSAERYLRAIGR
jgi:hypothetical protein